MKTKAHKKAQVSRAGKCLPQYCDFTCPNADFADPSAVGACRREMGVMCTLLKRTVAKNGLCIVRAMECPGGGSQ